MEKGRSSAAGDLMWSMDKTRGLGLCPLEIDPVALRPHQWWHCPFLPRVKALCWSWQPSQAVSFPSTGCLLDSPLCADSPRCTARTNQSVKWATKIVNVVIRRKSRESRVPDEVPPLTSLANSTSVFSIIKWRELRLISALRYTQVTSTALQCRQTS